MGKSLGFGTGMFDSCAIVRDPIETAIQLLASAPPMSHRGAIPAEAGDPARLATYQYLVL
jgi:hypothetical protein